MSTLIACLHRLLDSEEGCLNASAFTKKQKQELEDFSRTMRLITIAKKGRSTQYQILNRESIVKYINVRQPFLETQLDSTIPARSRNIALDSDSKKGQSTHESCYLLMKAWDDSVVWQDRTNIMHPAKQTENFGLAALCITSGQCWQTNTPIWFIENQALFDQNDWLPDEFEGCLIYYSGQLSNVLLKWLAERKRSPEIILFPDYDGVGLSNYTRLLNSLHADSLLRFYWMPDWEYKLEKFGNAEVWQKTRIQFENAIQQLESVKGSNDKLEKLAQLSQFYGRTLEQEAIWL
jgi:hypothetical protein